MKKSTIFIAAALFSLSTYAGTASGKVGMILINASNYLMFSVGTKTGAPACNTAANQWAISLDTAKGRSMYALLLYAQSEDKAVAVYGTNTCSDWPDREAPSYMNLQ